MDEEYRLVDIWVGNFISRKEFESYLELTYDAAEEFECSFASDQGIDHLDEDHLESSFHRSSKKCKTLLKDHSYWESYLVEAEEAFKPLGGRSFNSIVLVFGGEVEVPRSVQAESYSLIYLGRFHCDPKPSALDDSGAPDQIFLIFEEVELLYEGLQQGTVNVDSRGLCIGRNSDDTNLPVLDVSREVPYVADQQVRIYRDQFDQWVLEDVAGNGLTMMDGTPLQEERTFPWHGRCFSIGPIKFTWSIRPKL